MGRNKDGENRMIQTNTIGLKKPEKNEFIDVSVLNENFDKIDQCFSDVKEHVTSKLVEKPTQKKFIIPIVGWVDTIGEYTKKITITVSGVVADNIATVILSHASEETARECELSYMNDTAQNSIILYAKKVPTRTMLAYYYLI